MTVEFDSRFKQIDAAVNTAVRYSTADQRVDERKGTKDGEADFPKPDDEQHGFAFEVMERGRATFRRALTDLETVKTEAQNRIDKLERDRDDRYEVNRENRSQERDSALAAVENRFGRNSADYSRATSRLQELKDERSRIHSELGRPCRARLPLLLYVAILVVIAIAEVPVNQVAFTQIVENNLGALGIAFAVGSMVALAAHLVGEMLIHSRLEPGFSKNKLRYGVSFAVVAFMLVVFYFVSVLRDFMLRISAESGASFADLLRADAGETLGSLVTTSLTLPGVGLFVVNFVVFLFGVIMSWLAHDPHPDYPSVVRNEQKWQRRSDKIRKHYEKKLQEFHDKFDTVIANLNNQIAMIDEEIQTQMQGVARIDDKVREYAERVASYVVQRINKYETANRMHRKSDTPVLFNAHKKDELIEGFLEDAGLEKTPNSPLDGSGNAVNLRVAGGR